MKTQAPPKAHIFENILFPLRNLSICGKLNPLGHCCAVVLADTILILKNPHAPNSRGNRDNRNEMV
ncbi:hypothetical protein FACS1894111_04310 [Clostridia bacterium]|nr:hypothetical protein FACS1894111_04310 [Clostridia bacterium]